MNLSPMPVRFKFRRPSVRMRNIIAIELFSILLFGLGAWIQQHTRSREVTLKWHYDYGENPPCPTKLHKTCVVGFNVFIGPAEHRRSQLFVPNRIDQTKGTADPELSGTLHISEYGTLQLCVAAIGQAANEKSIESFPLCAEQRILPFSAKKNN